MTKYVYKISNNLKCEFDEILKLNIYQLYIQFKSMQSIMHRHTKPLRLNSIYIYNYKILILELLFKI